MAPPQPQLDVQLSAVTAPAAGGSALHLTGSPRSPLLAKRDCSTPRPAVPSQQQQLLSDEQQQQQQHHSQLMLPLPPTAPSAGPLAALLSLMRHTDHPTRLLAVSIIGNLASRVSTAAAAAADESVCSAARAALAVTCSAALPHAVRLVSAAEVVVAADGGSCKASQQRASNCLLTAPALLGRLIWSRCACTACAGASISCYYCNTCLPTYLPT